MHQTVLTLAADPISQVVNQRWTSTADGWWLWSAHIGNLLIASVLTLVVLLYAAAKIKTGPESLGNDRFLTRSRGASLIEVIICYIRDEVLKPFLGKRTNAFMPFLLTIFFFILINNLLGMVPISKTLWLIFPDWKTQRILPVGMTATQNIAVTAGLALIAFLAINLAGIRELGLGGYIKHLTADAPWYIWPIIVPIEIASTFIKPVALAIRLFANMTAGHILMVVLYGFAGTGLVMITDDPPLQKGVGLLVTVGSVGIAFGIFLLELMVALIQAFVFTFLTTVFISQLEHHHEHGHDDAHGHGDDHGHGKGHEHAHA
jgi:F-type H+-transporting ATPase subunit a